MFKNIPAKYKVLRILVGIVFLCILFMASKIYVVPKNPVSPLDDEKVSDYNFTSVNGNEIGNGDQNNENEVSAHNEQSQKNFSKYYFTSRNRNEIGNGDQTNKNEASAQNEQGQENGNGEQQEQTTQPRLQEAEKEEKEGKEWKTILLYTSWFGKSWSKRYSHTNSKELKNAGCPSWRCNFTMNKDNAKLADAIVFSSTMVSRNHIPTYRRPDQRWVWVNVEAPRASPAHIAFSKLNRHHLQSHFNWTMTYHSNADIVAFYGYLISKGEETLPLRPNLMSEHPNAMKKYMESLSKSTTLEDIMGPSWKDFVSRPKLVAWMSGHCGTLSRREQYVNELANYIPVDKFGRCGTKPCQPVKDDGCWKDILGPGYLFYMSFENDLCNEYITEKLYFALTYNLVPIVWGGSNYSRFLPPGSYINGRHYHPKDLASLLLRLQSDPVAYGRYHVWRGFWTPNMRGSMCELCHKLHTDKETKYYTDIKGWRFNNNKCIISPRWLFKDKNGWKIVIKPQQNGTSYGNF